MRQFSVILYVVIVSIFSGCDQIGSEVNEVSAMVSGDSGRICQQLGQHNSDVFDKFSDENSCRFLAGALIGGGMASCIENGEALFKGNNEFSKHELSIIVCEQLDIVARDLHVGK